MRQLKNVLLEEKLTLTVLQWSAENKQTPGNVICRSIKLSLFQIQTTIPFKAIAFLLVNIFVTFTLKNNSKFLSSIRIYY
jgi:hypothetical protein